MHRWLLAQASKSAEEEIELEMAIARVGAPAKAEGAAADNSAAETNVFGRLADSLLTLDDLAEYSPRDLRLMRNEIYAHHGRPFKSPLLREYFSNTDWYQEDASYTDARLSKLEVANIHIIRSVEDSLGGPITDDQDKDWFSGS